MTAMRRVRLSVAVSLDGFIAGPKGEYDWIPNDPDVDFGELLKGFDTILMGRKSYEASKGQGGTGMFGMPVHVFSSTLRAEEAPEVIVSRAPVETVMALRAQPGKDLWLFGGGELLRSFLKEGLVDGMDIAIVPTVLGSGLPLFPTPAPRTAFRLVSQRTYEKSGMVLLKYEAARATAGGGA